MKSILFCSLTTVAASKFDTCTDNFHRSGGLSLRESQEICLQKKPSEKIQSCQNKLFQFAFLNPQESLLRCIQDDEADRYYQGEFYHGQFEKIPVSNKKTVCSITVNSEEERESFRNSLNSNRYNFVELLPLREQDRFINRDFYWLDRACRSNIRCDTLVISGHFAGSFIGDAGFEVSMEGFEKYHSLPECKDFFESIKEVYLFGCNTLAGKKPDSRTIDQYVRILVTDGVAPHTAQRIAARRYTFYDRSVSEKMSLIFSGSNFIAGFPSVGPTGKHIQPVLNSYLEKAYQFDVDIKKENTFFNQTLAKTGMVWITPKTFSHSEFGLTDERLSQYIQTYGALLPVPTLDLLYSAATSHIINPEELARLNVKLQGEWSKLSIKERRLKLCPILLSEYDSLVPSGLDCTSDAQWLKN